MSSGIPDTMCAVVLMGHGGLDMLEYRTDWPVPSPAADQVLIRVAACGLNNTDLNTRLGWYSKTNEGDTAYGDSGEMSARDTSWGGVPVSFPRIQGADIVGEVVACGESADPGLIGKRIIADGWLRDWNDPLNRDRTGYLGSESDGGFAGYTVIHHRNVAAVDSPMSDAELATFSCSYTTAEGMLERAEVGSSDTVLVTGASGGVGSALIQLAKRRGARVVGMASESKHAKMRILGADALLPRSVDDLRAALSAAIGQESVSVVADVVGGPVFPSLIDVLQRGGRYTCSGAIAGPVVPLDLRTFYLRDLTFTGSTVIPPHVFTNLVGYIERGEVQPLLAHAYPLSEFHTAQQAFMEKSFVGNIVVMP